MDTACNINQQTSLIVQIIPTILAGLISFFVAYFSLRYQTKKNIEQIKNQETERNKEDKNTIIKIAMYYIKEELIHNHKAIEYTLIESTLNSKRNCNINSELTLPYHLKYELYKELKWNLMKYSDEKKFKDIIEIYMILNLFNHPNGESKISSIAKLSEGDYKALTELNGKMKLVIEELNKND